MKQRRIAPTLALLAGVGALGALASGGHAPTSILLQDIWQTVTAPRTARAAEAETDASTPIQNPFAAPTGEEPASVTGPPGDDATTPDSISLPQAAARYNDSPSLEPVKSRRANPHLADADTADEQAPPRRAREVKRDARPAPVKAKNQSVEKPRDRYADRRYAAPVAHNEVLPEAAAPGDAGSSQPVVDAVYTPAADADAPTAAIASQPTLALTAASAADARPTTRGGLSFEWITPDSATVGQEVTCQLLVHNTSDSVAQQVVVEAQLPAGVEPGSCEPRAQIDGRQLTWQLGDMTPGATTAARVCFTPRREGSLSPRAAVTCTHQAVATMQVVESRLALAVEGPAEAIVGQPATYDFRVTNSGSGPAVGVMIEMALDKALEAAGGKPSYNVGAIGPGESRHVQMTIVGSRQGEFAVRSQAVVGETVKDAATHAVRIVKPALTMSIEGPKLRFVDRKATYVIKVENPGPVAIDNVQVLETIPAGLRFVEASSGGSYDGSARQVGWFVGRLEANAAAEVGVQLIAAEVGDQRLTAAAAAEFGVIGETETVTEVKGAPRVVIDVTEDDDPVEVNGETVYRIRLSNIGSIPARRVQFAAEAPGEMQILDVNGPDKGTFKGQQVVFPPVASLAPGQTVDYDVHVRCTKAGSVRFRAYFRSEDTPNAVLEEEATRVYVD